MSNSSSAKHLIYPEPKKITNRNPVFRSTTNFHQPSSSIRPFTRKPSIQVDQSPLVSSQIVENDNDISNIQKSLLQVQSVASGGRSVRQSKFVRTNKNSFLSPKSRSKKKDRQESFSPDKTYGTQSMVMNSGTSQLKKSIKDYVKQKQKQSLESDARSRQSNDYFLQKSISSSNLYRKNNKTRNMILSKFSQIGRKSKDTTEKSNLDTSIHVVAYENDKEERKKMERINEELKNKNYQKQKQCENLSKQNSALAKENTALKLQLVQLKKKLQQSCSGGSSTSIPEKAPSQSNLHSYYQSNAQRSRPSIPLPTNENKKCQKCQEKQKFNQKQVTYFENIIKRKESELVALKRKQSVLVKQNSELSQAVEQSRHKFNELLEHQKIASQNEQRLEECVKELKEVVARLKEELRYLHIENSVLLKIKNDNLKLKIDITKIQDERDYFKMKVMEIHKKNGSSMGHCRSPSENFVRDKGDNKKAAVLQKSKKFYLDSTETQEMDSYNIGIEKRQRAKSLSSGSETQRKMQGNKFSKSKVSESDAHLTNCYADTLFDLTSQESENSY